jgi:hypothetical protein
MMSALQSMELASQLLHLDIFLLINKHEVHGHLNPRASGSLGKSIPPHPNHETLDVQLPTQFSKFKISSLALSITDHPYRH